MASMSELFPDPRPPMKQFKFRDNGSVNVLLDPAVGEASDATSQNSRASDASPVPTIQRSCRISSIGSEYEVNLTNSRRNFPKESCLCFSFEWSCMTRYSMFRKDGFKDFPSYT